MRTTARVTLSLVPALAVLALSACTVPSPPDVDVPGPASESPTDTSSPMATLAPHDADAALFVRATAVAGNGAQLTLELQVHQAYSWDYGGTQSMPAAIITDCGGLVTESAIEDGQWGFVRANLSAIAVPGTPDWPADETISLAPDAQFAYSSGRGMVTTQPSSGTPLCTQTKVFAGAGNGAVAIAIAGDSAALTGWTRHSFGFHATGATLTGCVAEVTNVGRQYGAETGDWATTSNDTTCVVGAPTETNEY